MFQKIKLFDLISDRLEIVKSDNKRFSILFSNIKTIIFYGKEKGSLIKYLYKETEQNKSMVDDDKPSVFARFKAYRFIKMMPYSIGTRGNKKEAVYIVRKSGFNLLKILIPWLNTLAKSKNYVLHPSEPREFFDQLSVAYEKWKRANIR
jgi:hypothetical protein